MNINTLNIVFILVNIMSVDQQVDQLIHKTNCPNINLCNQISTALDNYS